MKHPIPKGDSIDIYTHFILHDTCGYLRCLLSPWSVSGLCMWSQLSVWDQLFLQYS